ncbi:DNA helicase PIF1, ATP-dependent [Corchorus olitorius]|uniref:ATP-dependent DNA helicase n=1 Tax=Corchorus olitorius TaxID=93759 RepID=A0A1R3JYL4_9ROSI|nr:DNA helicase PIF1, ATP-dependent [Corchorus olitorius]
MTRSSLKNRPVKSVPTVSALQARSNRQRRCARNPCGNRFVEPRAEQLNDDDTRPNHIYLRSTVTMNGELRTIGSQSSAVKGLSEAIRSNFARRRHIMAINCHKASTSILVRELNLTLISNREITPAEKYHIEYLLVTQGLIQLPSPRVTPPYLYYLLKYEEQDGLQQHFRMYIRLYNSMFQFTSFGAYIDNTINAGLGPFVFRINKQIYHRIGTLLPVQGCRPKFCQLYIYDTQNENENRVNAIAGDGDSSTINRNIIQGLMFMFDELNEVAKAFRNARDRFEENSEINMRLRLICSRDETQRNYIAPTSTNIAGLIVGNESEGYMERDIIVDHRSDGLQTISNLHPLYMSMQYPVLFPYGEDGFHLGMRYRESPLKQKMKRKEIRINYIYDHQTEIRVDFYENVSDAMDRGDTYGNSIGKKIILPASFTGSPRPDIVARVFKLKLDDRIEDLTKNEHFGLAKAVAYSVEFQKRGLPHVHILLWLEHSSAFRNSATIDKYISAEIPDHSIDRVGYDAVTNFMINGPCGLAKLNALCMSDGGDKEWDYVMKQTAEWATTHKIKIRQVFVALVMFSEVSNPGNLFEDNWRSMFDDILYRFRTAARMPNYSMRDEDLRNYVPLAIEDLLTKCCSSLRDKNLPLLTMSSVNIRDNRLIEEETCYNLGELANQYHQMLGKTYLWKTLIAGVRSVGKIVLAVASSGIASLLLPGGRTAHSRFKLPLNVDKWSTCEIKKGTQLAKLLLETNLVIWDEAPMIHKFCFEALDKTMRDIFSTVSRERVERPFGGLTMVLGGDFRQVLPVIPGGTKSDIINASICTSHLWKEFEIFTLVTNMRLLQPGIDDCSRRELRSFGDWLLQVGDGTVQSFPPRRDEECQRIQIPEELLIQPGSNPYENSDAPNQDAVSYPSELLNKVSLPGVPSHELRLKIGCVVMLMRNINQVAGLCNGTRLVILQLTPFLIEARIVSGDHFGDKGGYFFE